MDVMEYMLDKSRPENSVHYGKTKRFEKAKECPYFYCVFSMDEIG